jgi:type I restriction enzyme, R subunit
MKFNEDSRVKIPALLHFTRLGYGYLSLKGATWDQSSNIFPGVFKSSLQQINPSATPDEIERTLQEASLLLDNEDLGKAFHERLLNPSGVKLVNFEDTRCAFLTAS